MELGTYQDQFENLIFFPFLRFSVLSSFSNREKLHKEARYRSCQAVLTNANDVGDVAWFLRIAKHRKQNLKEPLGGSEGCSP